ncbi:MAG: hypothetical protein QOF51_1961 [Chloroflexota bacterium]|jgi:hypothetical protein|nr:hypothetical protein [Chloroflexota bacterium]
MEQHTARDLLSAFEGPNGQAELYEVVKTFVGRPGVEDVEYEVVFQGESQFCMTIGEASILACELSGDTRFAGEIVETGHSNV